MKLLWEHFCTRGWFPTRKPGWRERFYASLSEFGEMTPSSEPKEFTDYLDSLTNYERLGIPDGAGMDSDEGLDLGRMKRLLERLGNPHSRFKAVHVAGTKGKGSTSALLADILRAEGYSVGCYTSPHILSIRERMTLGNPGIPVSAEDLTCLFRSIKHKLDDAIQDEQGALTHFEILTATAFTFFAAKNVEIAIIEAGLGGARDATNVFSSSNLAASVITTIGEEHLLALGGSLESIALAKAGVIKQGCPVILGGPFLRHIEKILLRKAASMDSFVISAYNASTKSTVRRMEVLSGRPYQIIDLKIQVEADSCLFLELPNVKLRMLGSHQLQNACTAACTALCLRNQGWKISDNSIRAGLEQTCLPGRTQFLSDIEIQTSGFPKMAMLLDGAHTQASAKALADTVNLTFPNAHLALVVAMADDKDHSAFAMELLTGMKQVVTFLTEVDICGGKSRTASALFLKDRWLQTCKHLGINAQEVTLDEFLESSSHEAEFNDKRVIVSENSIKKCVIAANTTLQRIPKNGQKITIVTGSLHAVSSVLSMFK